MPIRSVMGLKKRSLSQSSTASQINFATKDRSLELAGKSAKKERPRLFRARHGAGERVAFNCRTMGESSLPCKRENRTKYDTIAYAFKTHKYPATCSRCGVLSNHIRLRAGA
jgi:hypothetical protein